MQHGSTTLYLSVRAKLIAKGSSLNGWCRENGISRQWATLSLKGARKGPAALELIARIKAAVEKVDG